MSDSKQMKGECNLCSVCCNSHAYIVEQEGLHAWLEIHGHNNPVDVEYLATVMVKKLPGDKMKIVFFDTCEYFDPNTRLCKNYPLRPQKCKDFPSSPEECRDIAQCSFNNKETI